MCLVMVIVLTFAVGFTVWLVAHRRETPEFRSATHILDERFARGEITEADYRRHRDLLHAAPVTGPAPPTSPGP